MTVTGIATPTCAYCGVWHSGTCPKVKSIEYHPDGTVRRVEFHDPNPTPQPDWGRLERD